MGKINCFDKIKHREVQALQDEFDQQVPDNTDMSEQEQKEIGKKIVLDYYKTLNNEINELKVKLNKEPSELPDKSEAGKTMATVYDNLISEIKNEANEQRKFKNQTSADQVQIIKTIEDEGQAAEIADNAEAAGVVIRKIDDVVNSTPEAQAREKGEKEVDGTVIKRQEPIPAITGNDVDVLFAKDVKQPAKYAVVELSDLQASHYSGIQNEKHFIPEAQPRNRGGLEVLKNEAKAKADVLDPSQLAENNIAYYGSPVINARGEVIQGNGRAEAIDYYYNNNQQDSKGYKKMIESKTESLGLDASEVAKMKQPVLVRMADVNDEQAIILGNYTSSDLEDVKQKDADVKAAIGKLSGEDLKRLSNTVSSKISESDTLKSAIRENAKAIINLLMDIGALRADNREQYFNADGVTPEGIDAAYNIVRQLLFEGGPNDLSGKFDNLPFAQREAIEKTIPAIISNPELKNHVQSVIEILHDKQENGDANFNTWAKQYDLFKGKSPVETYGKSDLALAKRIDEAATQKEISTTIKEVAVAMNGKPADMFESAKEGLPFEEAIAEKNITFQFQEPSSEEVNDMKEVIKEMVDADVLTLKEIQDKVATELEDDSDELRDLVTTAYHEYGKDKENTPKEVTGGVIGRIGKWLAKMFGGTQTEKIFIAKDTDSMIKKADEIINAGDNVRYSVAMPDGSTKIVKSIDVDVVNGFYSPLEKIINETKFDKLPAKQWLEKFAKGEEAKWTGLTDWLTQQQGSVSKADIQQYLKDNRIQVVEVVKTQKDYRDDWDKENDNPKDLTKFSQYQLEGEKENYKEVLVTMPKKEVTRDMSDAEIIKRTESNMEKNTFRSSHFDEPNILVHLRMNTRVDSDGKRVLFLEEVQSDFAQAGRKQGFKLTEQEAGKAWEEADKEYAKFMKRMESKYGSEWESEMEKAEVEEETKLLDARENTKGGTIPQAPFVTDTNAWTKLGLKVALKEAVKQGADKIAWTTGEQQNDRYDLSKQVDWINAEKTNKGDYKIEVGHKDNRPMETQYLKENELEANLGKELATKIINDGGGMYRGLDLKVGGKGMKGFYGSPAEGSLGIVGNVAKSLFKQEPKTVEVPIGEETYTIINNTTGNQVGGGWSLKKANDFIESRPDGDYTIKKYSDKTSTQHSIDITPEMKAQVEAGQPLFMRSPDGNILGFAYNGRIYLNAEHLNPNTPIHEAGHLMLEFLKQNDTKVYDRGIELVTGSRYYDTVKANKFYKEEASKLPADKREEYFKQEALAAAIGDRGAQFVTEAKKKGFAEWLNNLWEAIKNTLGLKNITAKELSELTLDEFAKRAAADILRQETEAKEALNEITDQLKNWGLSFKDAEIIQGVADTDEKILSGELSREQYLRMKINLLESQQTMQNIVRKARVLFGDNYIQMLMDIADTEKDISLPTKRNLATRLKEEVAQGNRFVFDKVAMWAKKFATEASAAMNLGKPIDSVKELDAVSEPANEIMNEIGVEIKEGENIVLDAVSETTSDEILSYQQREEDLLNEIADLKQQLEDLENKKNEEKPNKKSKLSSDDYAEKAKAANNRLGTDKKSIIDKIKEIIKKC